MSLSDASVKLAYLGITAALIGSPRTDQGQVI
jgi:hypothetical protein